MKLSSLEIFLYLNENFPHFGIPRPDVESSPFYVLKTKGSTSIFSSSVFNMMAFLIWITQKVHLGFSIR